MKITKAQLKQIIKEELSALSEENNTTPIEEGMENLTPENIKMVLDGLAQIGYVVVPVVAASVAITNAVHGKPDAEKEKADLYADAEQAGLDRLQNNP